MKWHKLVGLCAYTKLISARTSFQDSDCARGRLGAHTRNQSMHSILANLDKTYMNNYMIPANFPLMSSCVY